MCNLYVSFTNLICRFARAKGIRPQVMSRADALCPHIDTLLSTYTHTRTHTQSDKQLISLSELNNKHKNIHH